ncbi:hypothetical protein V8J88_05395 [Massilia sp. W12]|uniref:hypothetical protein n=1 Tax=Massilia sp. W12 TaxID=3126507 RepID=UPI0030CDD8CE
METIFSLHYNSFAVLPLDLSQQIHIDVSGVVQFSEHLPTHQYMPEFEMPEIPTQSKLNLTTSIPNQHAQSDGYSRFSDLAPMINTPYDPPPPR